MSERRLDGRGLWRGVQRWCRVGGSAWLAAGIAAIAAGARAEEAGAPAGLIGHWPMNEGQGYIIHDQTKLVGDGELFGVEWAPLAGGGHALQFGGRYPAGLDAARPMLPGFQHKGGDVAGFSYGRLPIRNFLRTMKMVSHDNPAEDQTRQMAVSVWVKPVDGGVAQPEPERKCVVMYGGAFYIMINSNRWQGLVSNLNPNWIVGPEIAEGAWTHLLLGYDDVFAHMYVNGVEVGRERGPYLISQVRWPSYEKMANYALFYLGAQSPVFNVMLPYKGLMGEVKLFNRMPSAAEAAAAYAAGRQQYR